jgi:putative hydrolase of the HAD superfamily
MTAARVELVLLDMGGVLLPEFSRYERAAQDEALLAALRERGIREPEKFIAERAMRVRQAYVALSDACTQPDLDAVLGDCAPDVRRLLLLGFAAVADRRPYAHVAGVLRELARSARLALVSNTIIPGDHHRRTLERYGLMRWFELALWSANFGRRKPDPAMILHALGQLGVPARNALFVGDKLRTDVLAARRAHVRSVHLRHRGTSGRSEAVPDFVIRDLRELPLLLRRLG